MSEKEILDDLCGRPKWKNKYKVSYCEACQTFIINCEICHNSSCNGGGCINCIDSFEEFGRNKTRISDYLTEEENKVFHKAMRIKDHMDDSLPKGESEINWKQRQKDGQLSQHEEENDFKGFLK